MLLFCLLKMSETEESQEGPLGFADYFDEEELQSSQIESKSKDICTYLV